MSEACHQCVVDLCVVVASVIDEGCCQVFFERAKDAEIGHLEQVRRVSRE